MLRPVLTLRISGSLSTMSIPRSRSTIHPFLFLSVVSANLTSSLRLLDVLLFFLVKFFIALSFFLFPFHCFQSRIPCPFDDQSLLRTSRSCISTSLAFLRPAGILLPALLPSGQPRSFYSFCNAPTIFLFFFPRQDNILLCVYDVNIIIIPTFACTMSLYREGKHVI